MTRSADGRFEYRDAGGDPIAATSLAEVHRVHFRCRRNGRKFWCGVNIKDRGHDQDKHNWTLSGSLDAPTLHPSINCEQCWHGYIEDGVFKTTDKKPEPVQ